MSQMPSGVAPVLAPDATALGQIYYYVLEPPDGMNLAELRSMQDFFIKYVLQSVDGVAEVGGLGISLRWARSSSDTGPSSSSSNG